LGYIVEAARRYLDLFKVKLEEGETVSVTEQQLEQLRSLVQILTTEGVARTLKNLVCSSLLPKGVIYLLCQYSYYLYINFLDVGSDSDG